MGLDMHPALIFLVGALLAAVLRGTPRKAILLLTPVFGLVNILGFEPGQTVHISILDYELTPLRVDRLSLLFGYLFHLAAFISNLYALHLKREDHATIQHVAALLYAGGALGAVFAGDVITLFGFWELLAFTSVFLIWTRGTETSFKAGFRYLVVHVLSGVILLSAALLRAHQTGSIEFGEIGLNGTLYSWLFLIAFGIKAAFPFMHNWLTDAYPEATATGAVYLSAFTTKVAVYALARSFAGTELLIYIGAAMTCFPIFYAVIENDLRRVLGFSMINQIGFMVCGIGVGSALAINGAVAHAFNDVLFKGLLFMSMGSVLHMTGRIKGSDLGGLYKSMPITAVLCMIGAASISAFPLLSAFISKSMVMAAVLEEGYVYVWPFLLFAAAGVFEHAGIKIPYFAFFAHDSGIRTTEPPKNMLAAMMIAAVLCVTIGTFPNLLYSLLPLENNFSPYDATHVLTQLQLLAFGALAFVGLQKMGIYPPELRKINLDFDWTYRRLAPRVIRSVGGAVARVDGSVRGVVLKGVRRMLDGVAQGRHGPRGVLARTWPTGSMIMWVAILLAAYLVFYLVSS